MIPRPNCDFRSGLAVRREKKILINCFSILISILRLPASFMRHFCPSEAPFSDKLPLEKYIIHAKESLQVCIDVRLLFFNWHWNWLMFASISYLQHILILSGEIHLWSNWLEVPVITESAANSWHHFGLILNFRFWVTFNGAWYFYLLCALYFHLCYIPHFSCCHPVSPLS